MVTNQLLNPEVRRVFIVRPWHSSHASLYPHIMDGVEYIDAVVSKIKSSLREYRHSAFDVRVDADVFIHGLTLRENIERELMDADLVLVLLDGLRPNVIYELGFAFGRRSAIKKPLPIICLCEQNATILVRNYYLEPMTVPTVTGEPAKILNPRLDISRVFSDNSDLLVLRYDRLDLDRTLEQALLSSIQAHLSQQSNLAVAVEATETEKPEAPIAAKDDSGASSPTINMLWQEYKGGNYQYVIDNIPRDPGYSERKVFALSLMRQGRISEALQQWKILAEKGHDAAGALFHLGVCNYIVGEYDTAWKYFIQAESEEGRGGRATTWKKRAASKTEIMRADPEEPERESESRQELAAEPSRKRRRPKDTSTPPQDDVNEE